jgi:hypothetical protein
MEDILTALSDYTQEAVKRIPAGNPGNSKRTVKSNFQAELQVPQSYDRACRIGF